MAQSFVKDPDATLDYTIDWTAWLEDGDTIAASVWVVPDGITQDGADTHTDATTTIWLTGGTASQNYTVTNRITTASNPDRIDDRSIVIRVREK